MTINYRQVSVLTLLSLISMKFLALPSLMYLESDNMTWFVTLVLMLIDAVFAFLILSLIKRSGSKTLFEFLKEIFGPIVSKLILALLIFRYFVAFTNLTNGLEFFIEENFYHTFNWPIFIIPMAIVTGFMCYKGIRNIGRVSEIFVWAIVFSCVYISFRSLKNIDTLNFLPIFDVPFDKLASSSFVHIAWFGSPTFLLALCGKVDFSQEKKTKFLLCLALGIVLVQLLFITFIGLFGTTSPVHNFCISDVCQFATGKSSTDELLWLIVSIWIICQILQIALYTYCTLVCFKHLFNVKNDVVPIIINSASLIVFAYLGTKTINIENNFMSPYISIACIILQYVLPLVIWLGYGFNLLSKQKGVKNEKANN